MSDEEQILKGHVMSPTTLVRTDRVFEKRCKPSAPPPLINTLLYGILLVLGFSAGCAFLRPKGS